MNLGIIALTKRGSCLGYDLKNKLNNSKLYVKDKFFIDENNAISFNVKLKDLIKDIYYKHDSFLFIMATGIVVRTIAPFIKDKKVDPAIMVIDEQGNHIISLLSGHIGRANEYTNYIGSLIDATPVITTASDVSNKIAVDTIAMKLDCSIKNFSDATKVTSHIVNDELVGIISQIPVSFNLPDNVVLINSITKDYKGIINITNEIHKKNHNLDEVTLIPKNLIVGIGCKRGKNFSDIYKALKISFEENNLSLEAIKCIGTVDIKKDEEGIIHLAQKLKKPMKIVNRSEIKKVENKFKGSEFVKKAIGVSCVCEPVAYILGEKGYFIQNKKSFDGITIAIFKEGDKKWT